MNHNSLRLVIPSPRKKIPYSGKFVLPQVAVSHQIKCANSFCPIYDLALVKKLVKCAESLQHIVNILHFSRYNTQFYLANGFLAKKAVQVYVTETTSSSQKVSNNFNALLTQEDTKYSMTSYAPPLEQRTAKSIVQTRTCKVILVNAKQVGLIKGALKIFIKPMTVGTPGKVLLYNLKITIISHSAHVNPKGLTNPKHP